MEPDNAIRNDMIRAIFDVFEKMYYLYLEPPAGDGGCYDWQAWIAFSGTRTGRFEARFSGAIATAMVQNSLVLEREEVTDLLREDCLKECVNMICGSFLRLVDPQRIAHLSIPACSRIRGADSPGAGNGGLRLQFEADGMRVAFATELTEQQASRGQQ